MTNALWQPQAHMPSVLAGDRLTIVSGEGANVTTDDGRTLLDATAGLWHANIGHGRPELAEAAAAQMRKLETYHTFGRIANDQALALAERLEDMSPIADPKVFFVSGGSDAIDTAAKLGRRYWQLQGQANKRIIISRQSSYHGLHAFGTSLAGIPVNREGYGSESLIPETARVPANDADAFEQEVQRLGARPGGRDVRRADHRHRRRDPARARLPAADRGDLPRVRHPVRARRGDHRLRAHRRDVRHRAVRAAPRHGRHGQGDHLGLCAAGRPADRAARGSRSSTPRTPRSSVTASPTRATPRPVPSPRPTST